MITSWQLYLITRLDGISVFFVTLTVIFFVFGILICSICDKGQGIENFPKKLFLLPLIGFIFMGLAVLTPTTKEMAAILIVPKITNAIANNEEIQKLPNNFLSLANEWIEELKPKNNSEGIHGKK